MYSVRVAPDELLQRLKISQRRYPDVVMRALNDTAFDVRADWRDEMPRVFDRPTALTLNAVLYEKATRDSLVAQIYIRNHVTKGTPPAKYLMPQVAGGTRRAKGSERLLRRAGVLSADEYWLPGRSLPLDSSGNVPPNVIRSILSDVQASFDPAQYSSAKTRQRRARRKDINKREVYFYSRGPSGDRGDGRPQHLQRGIYGRTRTAFGSALRLVMYITSKAPAYRKRYDVFALADRLIWRRFARNYRRHLARLERSS